MNDRAAIRGMRSKQPIGLVVTGMLILLLLVVAQLWVSYQDQVKTAEISTRNLAAIFEARLDATLRRTDADLQTLAASIPREAMSQSAVPLFEKEINANLDSRVFNIDEMAGYRVHDANGDTLYSSDSVHVKRINISDRPYFRQVRDDPGIGLLFSEVVTGRSLGRPVMVIIRAVRDRNGKFLGIVHGMLELDYYRRQFQALNLGAHGVIALRRSDNHAQVARWPDIPGDLNRPLAPDHPVALRLAASGKIVSIQYSAPPENIPRIMGIQSLQNYPFYFAVGLGQDEVLSGWHSQVMVVSISTLLLFVLLGFMSTHLRRMRVREAGILTTLEQSELKFSELAQMVPVGICHFDRSGMYTYVNDRHLVLSGRSRSEYVGSYWTDFIHPDDRVRIQEAWERSGQFGCAFVCEYRFARPDGQYTYVIGEIQTEVDDDEQVVGFIVAQTDITQRKETEAQLLIAKQQAETANRAKTRFLAAASHDLRQPIQAINLFRDALGRTDLNAEQKTIFKFLSLSVHSLGELLYLLLDISKLDAGQIKALMSPVQVEDLFRAIDGEFSSLAQQRNLRFKLFYPFKSMVLLTDHGLLMSVLRNLIDNAFKYTEQGGVLVGVRKRRGYGVIQVWDTGIGIDPIYGDQIFEECFQVGNVLHDRTKGLGIGLSIARRMARLLDGDVYYHSKPGQGSVFEIVLPLADDQVLSSNDALGQEQEDDADLEGLRYASVIGWRVVVIDDDPMVAKSIQLLLESLDVRVQVFSSAERALASPDILGADFYISDFSLPGASGLQLLDAIAQRSTAPVRAVLLTGETAPDRVAQAVSSRWPVLFKPANLSKLVAVMKNSKPQSGPEAS